MSDLWYIIKLGTYYWHLIKIFSSLIVSLLLGYLLKVKYTCGVPIIETFEDASFLNTSSSKIEMFACIASTTTLTAN